VAPLNDFEFGTITDIPGTIRLLVTRDGDGVIVFDPELATIGEPKKYTINVHVEEGTEHKKCGVKPLSFEILKRDPKLTVGTLADFEYGTIADIPAAIKALVKKDSPGDPVWEPVLTSIGEPAPYSIKIKMAADAHYKEAEASLSFKILKLTPVFTVGKLDDQKPGSTVAAKTIQALVNIVEGDGAVTFDPPLPKKPIEKADIYTYTIYLAESPHYNKSDPHVLTFRILMSSGAISNAIGDWEKGKDQKLVAGIQKKKYDIVTKGKFGSRDEVEKALNSIIGPPERHTVWRALGYTLSSGGWTMDEKFATRSNRTFHFTLSADSIVVPANRADWNATPQALFNTLFLTPVVNFRVHMTLEAPKRHAYLGNPAEALNGLGNPLSSADQDNKDMIDELDKFRGRMVAKITQFKQDFGLD
jgi:hypothetical protein